MRAKALFVLLGVTALGAYIIGRGSRPVNHAPIPAAAMSQPFVARPVAVAAPVTPPVATPATSGGTGKSVPAKARPEKAATAHAIEQPAPPHRGDPHQAAGANTAQPVGRALALTAR
jgi:hypothetical protein